MGCFEMGNGIQSAIKELYLHGGHIDETMRLDTWVLHLHSNHLTCGPQCRLIDLCQRCGTLRTSLKIRKHIFQLQIKAFLK